MKIGLIPVNVGVQTPQAIVAVAQKAEEVGVESLWTFEHAIVPLDYQSKYPYSADGKMGAAPETNFVDPLIALTLVAANTERIRLGTGVNILPQVSPLLLAKQAASLDFVSGGRFMLGVGIGWLREEFDAMGASFERRGARFDDYIDAMRKVWSEGVVEHEGEFVKWTGFKSHPLPVQEPFPVVIGGSKGKAFQRVAKYGQGWFVPTSKADDLPPLIEKLEKACEAEGRDASSVEITAMWIPAMEGVDSVSRYRDLGVERLIVPVPALGGDPLEQLPRFADEVLAKVA